MNSFGGRKELPVLRAKCLIYKELSQCFEKNGMRVFIFGLILFLQAFGTSAQDEVVVYKEQHRSLINWNEIDAEKWLDLDIWKLRTESLAASPDWEKRVRELELSESVGRVLSCVGKCRTYRGRGYHPASYRTKLFEGDEIETEADSYLWMILIDGTMVRLSPQSSISLKEINIGLKENFLQARFNYGNLLWLSRTPFYFVDTMNRETDTLFLPLEYYEANQEEIKNDIYGSEKNDDILYDVLVGNNGLNEHIARLNKLILANNEQLEFKKSTSMLVMGNGTILGENVSVEVIVSPGKETLFKLRSLEQLGLGQIAGEHEDFNFNEASFQYRGYENSESSNLEIGTWYSVDARGRDLNQTESTSLMRMGEFLTSKISTLSIARELWIDRDFYFAQSVKSPLSLAVDYGYRMWEVEKTNAGASDLSNRISWLSDYTRRIETSNLQTASLFRERLAERNETWEYVEYGPHVINRALVNYIKKGEAPHNKEGRGPVLNSTNRMLWKKLSSHN